MSHGHDAVRGEIIFSNASSSSSPALLMGATRRWARFFLAQHLPRHNVGVVLHGGDEHFVACCDIGAAVGFRHQVDGFSCAADKDDFVGAGSLDKAAHRLPRLIVRLGGAHAEGVHAAMDVGVVVLVITHQGVDHRARLLRSGCAIQIDQLVAVDLLIKDGEIALDAFNIQRRRTSMMYRGAHPTSSQFCFFSSSATAGAAVCAALTSSCRRSRISFSANSRAAVSFMRSRHSAAKA